MRPTRSPNPAPVAAAGLAAAAALVAALATGAGGRAPRPVPAFVFVSRAAPADPAAIPGLGPGGRALAPGGRLRLGAADGTVRDLLPDGAMFDVADPEVSPDARRVAFAGLQHPDSAWRLWLVNLDGTGLARITHAPPASGLAAAVRADDLDPTWISEHALVFASTRDSEPGPYGGAPAPNLWRLDLDTGALARLTAERNGAEEPRYDPVGRRVLFARWWFNRHRAVPGGGLRAVEPGGAAAESASVWHVMEISPDGGAARVAAGDPRARRSGGGTQPAALADGRIAATYARAGSLWPQAGDAGVHVFDRRFGAGRRLAGPILGSEPDAGAYGGTAGLASPRACAPAPLPDGRLLVAYDPGGRGDFGLWLADPDAGPLEPLVDDPGTLELDPAPVIAWEPGPRSAAPPPALPRRAPRDAGELAALPTFAYRSADVFAGREGPPRREGARLRFFAALARPGVAGGDTAVLLREVAVGRDGRVDEALPAGVPLFEQLADAEGRVLAGPLGPAHVAGLNVGPPGGVMPCAGCHVGHSVRPPRPALGR